MKSDNNNNNPPLQMKQTVGTTRRTLTWDGGSTPESVLQLQRGMNPRRSSFSALQASSYLPIHSGVFYPVCDVEVLHICEQCGRRTFCEFKSHQKVFCSFK